MVAVAVGESWGLELRTTGAPKAVTAGEGSRVDGFFDPLTIWDDASGVGGCRDRVGVHHVRPPVPRVEPRAGPRCVQGRRRRAPGRHPRANYGSTSAWRFGRIATDATANPPRLFLDRADLVNVGDIISELYTVTAKSAGGTVGTVDVDMAIGDPRNGTAFAGRDDQWELMPLVAVRRRRRHACRLRDGARGGRAWRGAGHHPFVSIFDLRCPRQRSGARQSGRVGQRFLRRPTSPVRARRSPRSSRRSACGTG